MHPRLRRAWHRAKVLGREARLQIAFRNSSLIPLCDAVDVAIQHLSDSDRLEIRIPDSRSPEDVAERRCIANSIGAFFPLWGKVNGNGELGSIDYFVSCKARSFLTDDGRLVFGSAMNGCFTDIHTRRRYVLAWIQWVRSGRPTKWRERQPPNFGIPPHPFPESALKRQGQEADFDDSEVMDLLLRKLEAMDKAPKPELDLYKPKKRWRKRLKRK